MPEIPTEGPSPLLNIRCSLSLQHFAGGSGNMAAMARAVKDRFNVSKVRSEDQGPFPNTVVAELDNDRISLSQYNDFRRSYGDRATNINNSPEIIIGLNRIDIEDVPEGISGVHDVESNIMIEVIFNEEISDDELASASQKVVNNVNLMKNGCISDENYGLMFTTTVSELTPDDMETLESVLTSGPATKEDIIVSCGMSRT